MIVGVGITTAFEGVVTGVTGTIVVGRTHGVFVTTTFGVVVGVEVVGSTHGVFVTVTLGVIVGVGMVGRTVGVFVTATFGVVEGVGLTIAACNPWSQADICELS